MLNWIKLLFSWESAIFLRGPGYAELLDYFPRSSWSRMLIPTNRLFHDFLFPSCDRSCFYELVREFAADTSSPSSTSRISYSDAAIIVEKVLNLLFTSVPALTEIRTNATHESSATAATLTPHPPLEINRRVELSWFDIACCGTRGLPDADYDSSRL